MPATVTRREFLAGAALAATQTMALPMFVDAQVDPPFKISLAQWSLHKALHEGRKLDHLDFAKVARTEFGIDAIEYVNTFFKDKATDAAYLAEMNRRATDHGVYQHLIMCDGEGGLGDPDAAQRTQAVENHYKWVDAAKTLWAASPSASTPQRGHPRRAAELCRRRAAPPDRVRRLAATSTSSSRTTAASRRTATGSPA